MSRVLCLALALSSTFAWGQADGGTLIEWRFDGTEPEGRGRPNHVADLRTEDGALQGRAVDWDPFVVSPQFEIAATAWQVIELRLRTDRGGGAEVFWTGTTQSQYGGFTPGKSTRFEVIGDGEWHTYRLRPWWHTEGRIILLRLDLPRAAPDAPTDFAVDFLRIVDLGEPAGAVTEPRWDFTDGAAGWSAEGDLSAEPTADGLHVRVGPAGGSLMSGPLRIPVGERFWAAVELSVAGCGAGELRWAASAAAGLAAHRFALRPDGRPRTVNIDLSSAREWDGDLLALGLSFPPGATVTLRSLSIAEEPQGPAEVEVTWGGLEEAVNRVGPALPFVIALRNRGGTTADDLRIAELRLPPGMTPVGDGWRTLPPVEPFVPITHRFTLSATAPAEGLAEIVLAGSGAPDEPVRVPIEVTPSLGLPPADYVPEPRPVPCDYEIGAYYFPGWMSRSRWDPVERNAPERKPVLGWYDEADPEVVDWQIKWAVEHGISLFMVDWYWEAGARHLTHWLHDGYFNARYRGYLKWCMMWANHNRPGTHSEEDMRAVTQYWLDHYFGMEEYYRIDGMPVVIIWSPDRMRGDMGGSEGVRRLLGISQQMARDAGLPGICFVAMKWPEASTDPAIIQRLADEGFAMTTIYHYMGHGGAAADPRDYPFELVADSTLPFLRAWHEADIIPFFPAISTGWDSRPWHGEGATVIRDRTVPLFRRICDDVRGFADETGLRRVAVGPLNEWGEGSYLEPCREFGFEMYDALRDAFCAEPPGGWPPNITPRDVGLGPYDLPAIEHRLSWEFEDGAQGWGPFMGIGDFRAEGGALHFTTTSSDPALSIPLPSLRATDVARVVIRMKIDALGADGERGQLFWSTTTAPVSEATSVTFPLVGDGEYHEYTLEVAQSERWRRQITSFRLDPCGHAGALVSIDEIRLEPREP